MGADVSMNRQGLVIGPVRFDLSRASRWDARANMARRGLSLLFRLGHLVVEWRMGR